MSHFDDLPNELVFMIAQNLPDRASLSALMRTKRRQYFLLQDYLYDQLSGNEKNDILTWASEHGHESVVQAMLKRGGDIRFQVFSYPMAWRYKPRNGQCLLIAITAASQHGHASILRLLLKTQPSALNMHDGRYNVRALINAATNGHAETVRVLLEHSANIPLSAVDEFGSGPPSLFELGGALNVALRCGHEKTVKIMLEDTRISLDDRSLTAAAWGGNEQLVALCLTRAPPWVPRSEYCSPLGAAAQRGNVAVFKMLLNTEGMDPNMRDNYGRTPLAVATEFGQEQIFRILLETPGVEVDPSADSRETPLACAARRGRAALVEALLATGAVRVDGDAESKFSPLYYAAFGGHEKVVSMLLAAGANPEHQNLNSRTALAGAAAQGAGRVVRVLLATGQVDPDSKDYQDMTPLMHAARSGRFLGRPDDWVRTYTYDEAAEKLIIPLLKGEQIAVSTPIDLTHEHNPTQDTSTREALSVIKQLLASEEVNPNAQDADGRTALSHAAQMHEVEAVRALVEDRRVDVNLADNDGWTPMTWIRRKRKPLHMLR